MKTRELIKQLDEDFDKEVCVVVDNDKVYKKFTVVHNLDFFEPTIYLKIDSANIENQDEGLRVGEDKFAEKGDGTINIIRKAI